MTAPASVGDTVALTASGRLISFNRVSPGAGVTSTALFNLEQNTDQLTLQSPPNNGVLTDVGALGLDISGSGGFDIGGGDNGLVLAALRAGTAGPFSLYTVSLSTGAVTPYRNASGNAALSVIGGAGGPVNLIDIAIRL